MKYFIYLYYILNIFVGNSLRYPKIKLMHSMRRLNSRVFNVANAVTYTLVGLGNSHAFPAGVMTILAT